MTNNFTFIKIINVEAEQDYYIQIKHIVDEACCNRKILSNAMNDLIMYLNEALEDYEHIANQFLGEKSEMKILNYTQREEMKIYGHGYDALIQYAHWQRFIEPFVKEEKEFPDFITYKNWLVEFPGWSYGRIDDTYPVKFDATYYPMNDYYDNLKEGK